MVFDFTGKKILITGAGSGIGRNLTLEIATAGGEVYALSRTKETLDTLSAESNRIHPIVADLSDWDKTRELVDELEVLDGVVNNAATATRNNALDSSKEELEKCFHVNVLAAINIIQSTGKKMAATGQGGSIVNVSSIGGLNPVENMMAYCVSKAALDMVTKQFALELGRHQIRVNSVNLTGVLTERVVRALPDSSMLKGLKAATPMGRFCTLKESSDPIMYLLSEHSTMVTGTNHVVDGSLMSHIPV